jgi:hypothetical protein
MNFQYKIVLSQTSWKKYLVKKLVKNFSPKYPSRPGQHRYTPYSGAK